MRGDPSACRVAFGSPRSDGPRLGWDALAPELALPVTVRLLRPGEVASEIGDPDEPLAAGLQIA